MVITQSDDDGSQVDLGVEPGAGYSGGSGYCFEGGGPALGLEFAQCGHGFGACEFVSAFGGLPDVAAVICLHGADVVQEGFPPTLAGARVPARDQLSEVKAMAGGMLIEDSTRWKACGSPSPHRNGARSPEAPKNPAAHVRRTP